MLISNFFQFSQLISKTQTPISLQTQTYFSDDMGGAHGQDEAEGDRGQTA